MNRWRKDVYRGNNWLESIIFRLQVIAEANFIGKISSVCTKERWEAGSGLPDGGGLDSAMIGNVACKLGEFVS